MKEYMFDISRTAQNDLDNIVNYIVQTYNDIDASKKVYDNIMKKIKLLKISPEKNILVQSQPECDQGMRIQLADKYSVVYYINGDFIVVFRVVHSTSKYIAKLRGYY